MNWDSDSTTIHHRDESTQDSVGYYMGTTVIARYLALNDQIGAGKRLFLGIGLLLPSNNTFKDNPYQLSQNTLRHTHFTLSDGNYKGIFELQYFNRKKGLFFYGSIFRIDKSIKSSKYGYRTGDTYNFTGFVFLHHQKTLQYFSPFFTISTTHKTKDFWDGTGPGTGYAENSDGGYLNAGFGINKSFGSYQFNFSANKTIDTWLTPAGDEVKSIDSRMESIYCSFSIKTVIDY